MVDEEVGEGVEVSEVEGEGGEVVEVEEMVVSSVGSKVTFQESAPKQVGEEGVAEGEDEEEGAGADSRNHF